MSIPHIYTHMARVFPIDRDQIIADVQNRHPNLYKSISRAVRVAEVRTYVHNVKTLRTGTFSGMAVPAFASHWGVMIDSTLYHLVFRNPNDAQLDFTDFARNGKPIKFYASTVEQDSVDSGKVIGHTIYEHRELMSIGNALIESFGSYHRLFWNCQVFADCFLTLVAEKTFAE
jgi:hypothetical protein